MILLSTTIFMISNVVLLPRGSARTANGMAHDPTLPAARLVSPLEAILPFANDGEGTYAVELGTGCAGAG